MARGLFRKTSFNKMVGAYRSQWKRFWMRLFTFGMYGRKGMGWWRDPKRALYNWWYHRTSISIPRLLGYKPSKLAFFCAMLFSTTVSIVVAPFDAIYAAAKAHKIRKGWNSGSKKKSKGAKRTGKATANKTADRENAEQKKTTPAEKATVTPSKSLGERKTDKTSVKPKATPPAKVAPAVPEKKQMQVKHEELSALYQKENATPTVFAQQEAPKTTDEDAPKSKPIHEADQYIRKRLIIAGTDFCDQAVVSRLSVGTYIQLAAESENPKDKNAVALFCQGSKIGYIAQKDALPFAACLKLQREVYGVITDIKEEAGKKEIEYETWFSGKR